VNAAENTEHTEVAKKNAAATSAFAFLFPTAQATSPSAARITAAKRLSQALDSVPLSQPRPTNFCKRLQETPIFLLEALSSKTAL
jgi:hypothetical protein